MNAEETYGIVSAEFHGQHDDEVTCNAGDFVVIKKEFDDGWYSIYNIRSERTGKIPKLYLEKVTASNNWPSDVKKTAATQNRSTNNFWPDTHLAVALEDFWGQKTEGELSFNAGSYIEVTCIISDELFAGHLVLSDETGIFPSSYVELLSEEEYQKLIIENEKSGVIAKQNQQALATNRAVRQRIEAQIECTICCEINLIVDMVSCTDGHLFCFGCLQKYAKEIIYGQAKVLLTCLNPQCKRGFSRVTLELVLGEECLEKLDQRLQLEDINSAKINNLIKCKFCNYAAIVDDIQNKVFNCENPSCGKQFCIKCKMDWDEEHIGLSCEEVETKDETKLRTKMEETMTKAIVRQCNRCQSELVKKGNGCNKMTCRCGATMCYVCRTPNIDYNHFCIHVRTPGQGCTQCRCCSLWEDTTTTIDPTNLHKVRQEAQQMQAALGRNAKKVIGVDEAKLNAEFVYESMADKPQPVETNVPCRVQ